MHCPRLSVNMTEQASYAALAVQTREFIVITMWAGQLFGELLNWVIKHSIKQDRPIGQWTITGTSDFVLFLLHPLDRKHRQRIWLPFVTQPIYGVFYSFLDVSLVFSASILFLWCACTGLSFPRPCLCCTAGMGRSGGILQVSDFLSLRLCYTLTQSG